MSCSDPRRQLRGFSWEQSAELEMFITHECHKSPNHTPDPHYPKTSTSLPSFVKEIFLVLLRTWKNIKRTEFVFWYSAFLLPAMGFIVSAMVLELSWYQGRLLQINEATAYGTGAKESIATSSRYSSVLIDEKCILVGVNPQTVAI